MKYWIWSVVVVNHVHNDQIFKDLRFGNVEIFSKLKNNGYYNQKYIKSRPAIIIKVFSSKDGYYFLAIPIASKKPKKYNRMFRTEINFLPKKSYLMWENVLKIDEKQIQGLFAIGGKTVKLSFAAKKYIIRESSKINLIFEDVKDSLK